MCAFAKTAPKTPEDDRACERQVFIALKLAPEIAQELAALGAGVAGAGIRRIAVADIHLTLVPPWNESAVANVVDRLTRIAASQRPFDLIFKHVAYGPNPRRPRLLWAECAASNELTGLYAALLAAFERTQERPFRPHVTLARIRDHSRAAARQHPIDRELALSQRVMSVELMQSPPPGAFGYTVLASVPLGTAETPANPG